MEFSKSAEIGMVTAATIGRRSGRYESQSRHQSAVDLPTSAAQRRAGRFLLRMFIGDPLFFASIGVEMFARELRKNIIAAALLIAAILAVADVLSKLGQP
jgi:hypothetical protein